MATIVYCRNPLKYSEREILFKQGTLSDLAPNTELPFVCSVNGEYLLRKDWGYRVQPDDIVVYSTLLQGGGGGKNPLRLIATIALSVAAPGIGSSLATGFGFAASGVAASAFSAAVLIGGTALVNAVLPPPRLPTSQQSASINSPSSTYTLGAQANSARLGAAVPVLYGRHQIYPDLGDQPLAYSPSLKQQNLIQYFVVGQGEYTLSEYKIEDSPVESFKGIDIYPIAPSGANVLRTGIYNVVEVAGQELLAPVDGDNQWIGPFVINPPFKPVTQIHVEVAFPKGVYFANDGGGLDARTVTWAVQVRQIDDFGTATTDWDEIGTETITAADNAVLRVSEFYIVASGRYEVRLARTNAKDPSIRVGNDIVFSGCAGISNAAATTGQGTTTRIQTEFQASDNLNSNTARRFNLIAQRKLQIWNPDTGWSALTETRSIAWAFADICRSAGVPDSRINLQELYDLDQYYSSRAMFFDAVFDNRISLFEALTLVARAGRAVPIIQGGQITMVRDSQKSIAVAKFGMRNIRKGSFGISYAPPTTETANAVQVNYIDGFTYKPKQVMAVQDGTAGDVVSKVELFGVTDEQIATNEALYLVATNQYRRRTVKWSTEMDGFICRFGDLVLVSHDIPQWGISGDVIAWDASTLTATLSEPVEFQGGTNLIRFQAKNGSVSDAISVQPGIDEYTVVLDEMPPFQPYTGSDYEQTRFSFANSVSIWQSVKIRAIQPRGVDTIDVVGVIDDDRVYTLSNDSSTVVTNQATARYAPDDFNTAYTAASDAEKAAYGFYSKPNGLMSNSDTGYTYQ